MPRIRWATILIATTLVGACEGEDTGPPFKLGLEHVTESNDKTALMRATVQDEMMISVRATGELTWEFVESIGKKRVPRCKLTVPLTESNFKEPGEERGYYFEVKFTLDKPCKPLSDPDGFNYGLISLRLPDGRIIRDDTFSWVPHEYGGQGELNFPKQEAHLSEVRKKGAKEYAAIERLFADLGRVASARPDAKLAPGTICPAGLKASGLVLRADHRVLFALSSAHQARSKVKLSIPLGTAGFKATNDTHIGDLVKFQNGDRKLYKQIVNTAQQPRSHIVLVEVEKLLAPKAYSSEKFDTGFFGGEVWVVETASAKVLCRAKASAINSKSIKTTKSRAYSAVELDFISQVGHALTAARHKVAPGLVPPPPK